MRLSWNEIRSRAAEFARKWEGAGYEKGETLTNGIQVSRIEHWPLYATNSQLRSIEHALEPIDERECSGTVMLEIARLDCSTIRYTRAFLPSQPRVQYRLGTPGVGKRRT